MAERRGPLAFIPPRYGEDVVGGSEAAMREAAHGLSRRGWEIEVLTTCARDHYTWANHYPPGTTRDGAVTVRRFPVVPTPPTPDAALIERRIQAGLGVSPEEEIVWINSRFRVPELFRYLLAHAPRYRAVVLSPYLFWTTPVCATVAPERTIVKPCLHDEPYAYLELFRRTMRGIARGWFNTVPERDLAQRLGLVPPAHDLCGDGVVVPDGYDPAGFRARYGIEGPFVLYAGRREGGKGWELLLDAFAEATLDHGARLDLVTMGVGDVHVPARLEGRVHDLGFVPTVEVPSAFAAASALVQPSTLESFSRTVMEAWLAGTLVLANAGSDVVRWHCERSGAGLTWTDRAELVACLELVGAEPGVAASIAAAGRDYVLDNYAWPTMLDKVEASLEAVVCAG